MMQGNANVIRHVYKVERVKKNYTVYELMEAKPNLFNVQFVRVEQYRGYSKGRGFNEYFRIKDKSNWNKSTQVTGLFFTSNPNVFYGDIVRNGKKNLLVFQFAENRETLIVVYYLAGYPNANELQNIISSYY